jgi:hypothetical protein
MTGLTREAAVNDPSQHAATQFIARWRDRLPTVLDTLEALGRARRVAGADGTRWSAG